MAEEKNNDLCDTDVEPDSPSIITNINDLVAKSSNREKKHKKKENQQKKQTMKKQKMKKRMLKKRRMRIQMMMPFLTIKVMRCMFEIRVN